MTEEQNRFHIYWYFGAFFILAIVILFGFSLFLDKKTIAEGLSPFTYSSFILSFLIIKVLHDRIERAKGGLKQGLYIVLGILIGVVAGGVIGGPVLILILIQDISTSGWDALLSEIFLVAVFLIGLPALLATILARIDNISPTKACSRAFNLLFH